MKRCIAIAIVVLGACLSMWCLRSDSVLAPGPEQEALSKEAHEIQLRIGAGGLTDKEEAELHARFREISAQLEARFPRLRILPR